MTSFVGLLGMYHATGDTDDAWQNRYYTILLVAFDAAQIHSFSKFQPSLFE